ncbi:hypothetical protein [Paraburkholderia sp. BCC1876]|uniref:hypothetical protein n=1 Tax=Paraburkholderia sp. BCC1876 TaxID=2676303 RepID=UPI0015923B60|nr:hypothetical protein [Paraburkholderia sp. BCC1876]
MTTINPLSSPLETMRAIARKRDPARTLTAPNAKAQRDADKAALQAAVKIAKAAHDAAVNALDDFERDPRNHVYDTLEDAEATLHEALRDIASADCEGSHNCGASEYRQGFFVGRAEYVAIASVEYNRHDKTFYYVEEFDMRIEPVA